MFDLFDSASKHFYGTLIISVRSVVIAFNVSIAALFSVEFHTTHNSVLVSLLQVG